MGLKIYKNTPQKKIRTNQNGFPVFRFSQANRKLRLLPVRDELATFARQKYLEVVVHLRDGGSSVGDLFEHGGVAWTRSDFGVVGFFHDLKRSDCWDERRPVPVAHEYLVGGLEDFFSVGMMIQSDELIFFRAVETTN
jgi:hypothetical protein